MIKKAFLILLAATSILMLSWYAITASREATRKENIAKLHEALKKNDSTKIRELIDQDMDVDSRVGSEDLTPLMWACINGNLEMVKYLIEKGAGINNKDSSGNTPLYYAAAKGRIKISRLLIEKGADVNVEKNIYGYTPLDIANLTRQSRVAALLVQKGAHGTVASIQPEAPQQTVSVDEQNKTNSPAECAKLAAALKACDEVGGFGGIGCKMLAKSQFDCPAVANYM